MASERDKEVTRLRSLTTTTDNESQKDDENAVQDARVERRIKLKLDLTILPLLTSIQFFSQMARSDIGNAKEAGMEEELSINADEYSNLAVILLVGYIIFQLPGTMLLRKIGPPLQFGVAMILWGIFTASSVSVHSLSSLMLLRFLTGCAEAFIQGSLIYLSFWYRYNELATRGAFYSAMAALAGAFNGLLAHSIQTGLDGSNAWRAWRWIFLIEGVLPIGWGFLVIFLLPRTPETVKGIFSPAEKAIILRRSRAAHNTGDDSIRPRAMWQVLADPTFWLFTGVNCGVHFTVSSLPNFIPAILDGIGYSGEQAQLMSVVVYASAFVAVMVVARVADKTGRRGVPIVVNCVFGIVGFVLLLTISDPVGRLVATCIVAAAAYPCVLLTLVWLALSTPGFSHRTSSIAFINIAAQLFSMLGNKVYVDPPLYHTGLAVSAGMTGMAGVLAVALLWRLRMLNRRKEVDNAAAGNEVEGEQSIDEIGNQHRDFMYQY